MVRNLTQEIKRLKLEDLFSGAEIAYNNKAILE
jgi:hypothetical protein